MANIAIFRINYKSDFILTLNSDAGWLTPFCIKFWTGAPSRAYFVGFDGITYTHCAPVDGEPTKLRVQFDDHRLPIGDLKFQISYHFTVADFPTSVEDEVLNQASVIIEVDDVPAQVMLDLNGETAPEIEFSLPAYANEAQRIANEQARIAAEQQRIANEDARIQAEETRQYNEQQRIQHEEERVSEFARLKSESEAATNAANAAATLANEKAQLADDKATLAQAAATLANEKAQLAADKAALAQAAATLANEKAALAQQKATYAQTQGDYAKEQGDYAKAQGDTAQADHVRAEADHTTAADDHSRAEGDHTTAASDHSLAESDHTTAASDHSLAESDHTTAASDHSRAESDHTTSASDHTRAEADHTTAASDHETAASDHTRAESDHAAVEVYVDSLGAFDISSYHATGGELAKYADLTAALGTDGANIPEGIRKGGISVKFVQSSDNKYVQYRLMSDAFNTTVANWQGVDDEPTSNSENLVKSGGVKNALTIHLTYILYQYGTPTAEGQYYIHNGELRYCTYFGTPSNYRYTVIPFNPDILYEYKGFYFKWNGTSLVMLETSVSEHLRTVAEVDGVKDANALDISGLVSSTYTKLNTDGTISIGNQRTTLYHIPVNHNMRLRCRCYNTVVIGYKSIDDVSPVVLFNAGSTSASTIATYDVRIPEEIKYIRIGSGLTTPIYLIEDSLYLQETIDVDIAHPLESGYYTLATATAAVRKGNRTLKKKITFKTDKHTSETWQFNSVNISDWNTERYWLKENDEDYAVKGLVSTSKNNITLIKNADYVDGSDTYIEWISDASHFSGELYYVVSNTDFSLRGHRGNIQLYYRNSSAYTVGNWQENTMGSISAQHHFMLIKSRKDVTTIVDEEEVTETKHYLELYVDGVKKGNALEVTPYVGGGTDKSIYFDICWKFSLFRNGYFNGTTDDTQEFVLKHFNNGNPLDYVDDGVVLNEVRPENMHLGYVTDNKTGIRALYTNETAAVLRANDYDELMFGQGTPTDAPKYTGQKYRDTDTNDNYTAYGNTLPSDWRKDATLNDVNALKTQTKTVNGQSIWGSGDIEGGGSGSGGGNVISVLNYGAVGDGATDDTAAIMAATEAARIGGKALYFPNGTYLTRKSIVLTSGMKVTGEPNAVLQSASATLEGGGKCIFTTLTASAAAGATQITVNNAAGFVVGQEIVIWKSGSYTETMADITAINGNVLTIDTSRFTADGTNGGILNAVASGGYVLTDFALIKTIQTKSAVDVVVENVTIKAMSDMAEPHIYTSSPISQTKGNNQKNFRVYNVTVYDSANDGISVQGSGESEVIGCRVFNQKHKGIHWGTTHDMARIMNNYVYGCGSAQYEVASDYQGSGGMFFCSNNHRIIIIGNHIENCYKGIFGFNYQDNGECDSNTIIANNTFKNCTLYGVILRDGIHAVLEGNNFLRFGGTSIPIYVDNPHGQHLRNAVIANNTIGEWSTATLNGDNAYNPAIKITGADGVVLTGNVVSMKKTVNNSPTVDASRCNIVVIGSNNMIITNNITEGSINDSDSGNTGIVKANNIEAS